MAASGVKITVLFGLVAIAAVWGDIQLRQTARFSEGWSKRGGFSHPGLPRQQNGNLLRSRMSGSVFGVSRSQTKSRASGRVRDFRELPSLASYGSVPKPLRLSRAQILPLQRAEQATRSIWKQKGQTRRQNTVQEPQKLSLLQKLQHQLPQQVSQQPYYQQQEETVARGEIIRTSKKEHKGVNVHGGKIVSEVAMSQQIQQPKQAYVEHVLEQQRLEQESAAEELRRMEVEREHEELLQLQRLRAVEALRHKQILLQKQQKQQQQQHLLQNQELDLRHNNHLQQQKHQQQQQHAVVLTKELKSNETSHEDKPEKQKLGNNHNNYTKPTKRERILVLSDLLGLQPLELLGVVAELEARKNVLVHEDKVTKGHELVNLDEKKKDMITNETIAAPATDVALVSKGGSPDGLKPGDFYKDTVFQASTNVNQSSSPADVGLPGALKVAAHSDDVVADTVWVPTEVVRSRTADPGPTKRERILLLADLLGLHPFELLGVVAELEARKNILVHTDKVPKGKELVINDEKKKDIFTNETVAAPGTYVALVSKGGSPDGLKAGDFYNDTFFEASSNVNQSSSPIDVGLPGALKVAAHSDHVVAGTVWVSTEDADSFASAVLRQLTFNESALNDIVLRLAIDLLTNQTSQPKWEALSSSIDSAPIRQLITLFAHTTTKSAPLSHETTNQNNIHHEDTIVSQLNLTQIFLSSNDGGHAMTSTSTRDISKTEPAYTDLNFPASGDLKLPRRTSQFGTKEADFQKPIYDSSKHDQTITHAVNTPKDDQTIIHAAITPKNDKPITHAAITPKDDKTITHAAITPKDDQTITHAAITPKDNQTIPHTAITPKDDQTIPHAAITPKDDQTIPYAAITPKAQNALTRDDRLVQISQALLTQVQGLLNAIMVTAGSDYKDIVISRNPPLLHTVPPYSSKPFNDTNDKPNIITFPNVDTALILPNTTNDDRKSTTTRTTYKDANDAPDIKTPSYVGITLTESNTTLPDFNKSNIIRTAFIDAKNTKDSDTSYILGTLNATPNDTLQIRASYYNSTTLEASNNTLSDIGTTSTVSNNTSGIGVGSFVGTVSIKSNDDDTSLSRGAIFAAQNHSVVKENPYYLSTTFIGSKDTIDIATISNNGTTFTTPKDTIDIKTESIIGTPIKAKTDMEYIRTLSYLGTTFRSPNDVLDVGIITPPTLNITGRSSPNDIKLEVKLTAMTPDVEFPPIKSGLKETDPLSRKTKLEDSPETTPASFNFDHLGTGPDQYIPYGSNTKQTINETSAHVPSQTEPQNEIPVNDESLQMATAIAKMYGISFQEAMAMLNIPNPRIPVANLTNNPTPQLSTSRAPPQFGAQEHQNTHTHNIGVPNYPDVPTTTQPSPQTPHLRTSKAPPQFGAQEVLNTHTHNIGVPNYPDALTTTQPSPQTPHLSTSRVPPQFGAQEHQNTHNYNIGVPNYPDVPTTPQPSPQTPQPTGYSSTTNSYNSLSLSSPDSTKTLPQLSVAKNNSDADSTNQGHQQIDGKKPPSLHAHLKDGINPSNQNAPLKDEINPSNQNAPFKGGINPTNQIAPLKDAINTTNQNPQMKDGINPANQDVSLKDGINPTNQNSPLNTEKYPANQNFQPIHGNNQIFSPPENIISMVKPEAIVVWKSAITQATTNNEQHQVSQDAANKTSTSDNLLENTIYNTGYPESNINFASTQPPTQTIINSTPTSQETQQKQFTTRNETRQNSKLLLNYFSQIAKIIRPTTQDKQPSPSLEKSNNLEAFNQSTPILPSLQPSTIKMHHPITTPPVKTSTITDKIPPTPNTPIQIPLTLKDTITNDPSLMGADILRDFYDAPQMGVANHLFSASFPNTTTLAPPTNTFKAYDSQLYSKDIPSLTPSPLTTPSLVV